MSTILYAVWVGAIVILVIVALLFLRGAMSVEAQTDNEEACTCKRSRFAVWADINCPIHGESK